MVKKKHPKRKDDFILLPLREYRPDLVPDSLRANVKYQPYKVKRYRGPITSYPKVLLRLLREKDSHFMRWAAKDARAKKIAAKHSIKLPKIIVRKKVRSMKFKTVKRTLAILANMTPNEKTMMDKMNRQRRISNG